MFPPTSIKFPHKDQHCELRIPHPREVPALLEAVRDSLPELKRYMLWAHADNSEAFQTKRLIAAQAAYLEGKDFAFHLWAGERLVGSFGLHPRALNPRAMEVGYWIRTDAAGSGLATAAVKAVTVFNFRALENERLQCLVNSANKGSLRVAQKCGFKVEAQLKYWEPSGTEEQRADGFESSDVSIMHGITKEELDNLPWYAKAVEETEFSRNAS